VSLVKGAICVELTIGSKTLPTTFFVISGKGAYNLLLGRDWIHANYCIPSTMHQCLVQWVGDKIEIVPGDSSYVIASAEADTYERTRCISGEIWEKDFLGQLTKTHLPSHYQRTVKFIRGWRLLLARPNLAVDMALPDDSKFSIRQCHYSRSGYINHSSTSSEELL